MAEYVHYTTEQRKRARETDLVAFLESQGERVKRAGSEYEWMDGTAKVSIRGNLWFHQYEREGGDAIDFVKRFYEKNYPEAMELLLGESGAQIKRSPVAAKPKGEFALPEKCKTMKRVYAYLLLRRGLDKEVVSEFAQKGMIYESEKYHNAVFVGYDKEGKARHANIRGTGAQPYKGNAPNSAPEYSFHWHGTSEKLFLFEAPIDMLSYISMYKEGWQLHSYAACCGVSDHVLMQMLKDNPAISHVNLCLDNDKAGRAASRRIADKLFVRGIQGRTLVPKHKDWNEDLLARREAKPEQTQGAAEKAEQAPVTVDGEKEDRCQALAL